MKHAYLIFVLLALLSACTQETPETPKITNTQTNGINSSSQSTAQPLPIPETNDTNCQLEKIKSITDKQVQQTLADNCAKRSTLKPTKHKVWSVR